MSASPSAASRRPFRWLGIGAIMAGIATWLIVTALVLADVIAPAATPTAAISNLLSLPAIVDLPSALPTLTIPATVPPTLPPTATSSSSPTAYISLTQPPTASPSTAPTDPPTTAAPMTTTGTDTAAPVATSAATANGTPGCTLPPGWIAYHVSDGDTLFGFQLGSGGAVTVDAILKANCLSSKLLTLGQVIYLPAGVGQKAPKLDDSGAASSGTALPAGLSRTANCPCTLTIRPGLRREQVAALVDSLPVGFSGGDFLAVTGPNAPNDGFAFLSSKPAGAPLEGFLYPGTYTLQNSTSALAFRDQLLAAFDATIPAQWRQDAGTHGFTLYQALIFASIVQRESGDPTDQTKVASVMYNTLAAGHGLAATPTVQYIFGHPGAWWPNVGAAELQSASPYNTYHHTGLPPTPIDSPDQNAIRAAIYPAQTPYLYFAGCNGVNVYAKSYDEFTQQLKACGG